MDKITHLLLSFYVVISLIDLRYAYKDYNQYNISMVDAPEKSILSFFIDQNKWTFISCVSFYFWFLVYKVFA